MRYTEDPLKTFHMGFVVSLRRLNFLFVGMVFDSRLVHSEARIAGSNGVSWFGCSWSNSGSSWDYCWGLKGIRTTHISKVIGLYSIQICIYDTISKCAHFHIYYSRMGPRETQLKTVSPSRPHMALSFSRNTGHFSSYQTKLFQFSCNFTFD